MERVVKFMFIFGYSWSKIGLHKSFLVLHLGWKSPQNTVGNFK